MPKRILTGKVASNKSDKTVTVVVERKIMHPMYKKFVTKSKKFAAHDSENKFKVGDVVKAMKSVNQSILKNVIPVDIYQSKKDTSSKDVLFSLNFQSSKKTLEDNDVNSIITEIINIVSKKFNAKLRDN